jgi:serine/threonine protein kinase
MSESRLSSLRPSSRDDHDDLAGQLWDLWQQGLRPAVNAFLATAGSLSLQTLVAVLRVDQQQRWLSRQPVLVESYLSDYPCLGDHEDRFIELIYCEYLIREELGEGPTLKEYLARFPAHGPRLRQQIEVHQALDGLATLSAEFSRASAESVAERASLQATLRPLPASAPATAVPEVAGYEILGELGRGGMGVVYRARERRSGKQVALKVMQWADPVGMYRFKQEFRSLAGLNHPNLVSLYELAAGGKVWFFTMELIDGEPFLAHVRQSSGETESRLTRAGVKRLRAALVQLADGIHFLHAGGKLHRDIKPGNVLVTPEGRVVLLDFGLAAEMDSSGRYLSVQPRLLGTIPYMAPEQAGCQPLSSASDWYSVGVMLFEALTGRTLFEGSPIQVLLEKQQFDPPSPRDSVAGLPEDLVRLCEDLLRRDPKDRPTGEEVRRRLGGTIQATASRQTEYTPLIGRREHLRQLAGAFAKVHQGQPVVVSVTGLSGTGKTALVRHFLDDLEQQGEALVLSGRCYEQESMPFKGLDSVIDSLSRYLDGLSWLEVEAILPRDVASLAGLFPVLRQIPAVAAAAQRGTAPIDPSELRHRAIAGLRELLGRLGDRRPLVLSIDDLQWGDEDSASVLGELLSPPDAPRLLLLAAYRSEDAGDSPCLRAFAGIGQGAIERRHISITAPPGSAPPPPAL